jgi:Spy/CpxP family protein refolding chaperone
MKSTRTRVLVIGAAVILAVAAALAQGMHGRGGPGGFEHLLGFYSDYLDLSTAQQDQIKAIMQKEKPTLAPLMLQMKQFHSQMNQIEQSGAFDESRVRALATQQSQTMIELAVQHARIKSEMIQLLTADQKAKLAQFEAKREQRMEKHMQHMPEPPSD